MTRPATGTADPSTLLGSLRARQAEHIEQVQAIGAEIDQCMAQLVADGMTQAQVARLAGVQRAEVNRRLRRVSTTS